MDPFVKRFVRSSLAWLGIGVLIGLAMALWPAQALAYRPAHAHANLLGFVSMMIYGVAYHVIPRFTGNPLHSRRLAGVHLWVANLGLALLVTGWIGRTFAAAAGNAAVAAGALTSTAGAFLFIYNLWRTLDAKRRPAPARPGDLPVVPRMGR